MKLRKLTKVQGINDSTRWLFESVMMPENQCCSPGLEEAIEFRRHPDRIGGDIPPFWPWFT